MKTHFRVLAGFALLFALLFAWLPARNALPGNMDTVVILSFLNTNWQNFLSLFTGDCFGSVLFPTPFPYRFGEPHFLASIPYGLISSLGLGDVWNTYLLLVLIFATTAWSLYVFAGNWTENHWARVFAGLVLPASNFAFAQAEHVFLLAFVLPVLSMHFLMRFVRTGEAKHLKYSAVIGGVQAWVLVTGFVLQTFMLGALALFHAPSLVRNGRWRAALGYGWIYILIPAPLVAFHLWGRFDPVYINTWDVPLVMDVTALSFTDLFRVLENNRVYPRIGFDEVVGYWSGQRRTIFMGLLAMLCMVLAFRRRPKEKLDLLFIVLVGAAFSFAVKSVHWEGRVFNVPFYYHPDFWPGHFLRTPSRLFLVCAVPMSVLAGLGLANLADAFRLRGRALVLLFVAAAAVHLVENVPVPVRSWDYEPFAPPPALVEHFEDRCGHVLLHLPTGNIFRYPEDDELFYGANREVTYMYWQTYHRQYTVNGVQSYTPRHRWRVQGLVRRVFYGGELSGLRELKRFGVDTVVFHKDLVFEEDAAVWGNLSRAGLKRVLESPRVVVFRLGNVNGRSKS
ncbi:MAG: hypothetical protein ACLFOY_06290 [Desulfatibacillaceae bacterium]